MFRRLGRFALCGRVGPSALFDMLGLGGGWLPDGWGRALKWLKTGNEGDVGGEKVGLLNTPGRTARPSVCTFALLTAEEALPVFSDLRKSFSPAKPALELRFGFASVEAVPGEGNDVEAMMYAESGGDGSLIPGEVLELVVLPDVCRVDEVDRTGEIVAATPGRTLTCVDEADKVLACLDIGSGRSATGVRSIVRSTSSWRFDSSCLPVDARHVSGLARGGLPFLGDARSAGSGKLILLEVKLSDVLIEDFVSGTLGKILLALLPCSAATVIGRDRGLAGGAESIELRFDPVLVLPTSISTVAISHHWPNSASSSLNISIFFCADGLYASMSRCNFACMSRRSFRAGDEQLKSVPQSSLTVQTDGKHLDRPNILLQALLFVQHASGNHKIIPALPSPLFGSLLRNCVFR